MSDYDFLPVSNGSGDAALMHIQSVRITGSTVIDVDTVANVPSKFIGTYGDLLPSGFIDPATKRDFKGHVSGADLIIDAFEPGSTDAGNTIGQVVIIKPNTGWANRVAAFIKNATGFGTAEDVTFDDVTAASIVTSGNAHVGGSSTLDGPINGAGYDSKTIKNSYKFSVYRNAAANSPNAVFGRIDMDTKIFDTGNNVDVVTNKGRFTAPVAGFYFFTVRGETFGGNDEMAGLFKNGVEVKRGSRIGGAGIAIGSTVSGLIQLGAGDYVEPYYYTVSPQPYQVGATATYFDGFLVSAT